MIDSLIDRLRHPIYRTSGFDDAEPDFEKMQAERLEAATILTNILDAADPSRFANPDTALAVIRGILTPPDTK